MSKGFSVNSIVEKICKSIAFWFSLFFVGVILFGLFILPVFIYFSKDLPDYHQLTEYTPPTISRMYTYDGELMAELAQERRIFKSIDEIPELVKNAFISAEDQNYYTHPGIDFISILRAGTQNVMNVGTDRSMVGGSTITQQVVKNFLLTNERSISRKIKEAILAYRINNVYSKDRILELYLNQIYLGNGAYGVTQAALSYFNKDLKDLTLEEAALLAAMPKAPSNLDPTKHIEKAKMRRDWVIERMYEEKYITLDDAIKAKRFPIALNPRFDRSILDNGYYTETVRLELINKVGYESLYQNGYSIHTNINKSIQKFADEALRKGLVDYDRRHGWKGAIDNLQFKGDDWKPMIKSYEKPAASGDWKLAIVVALGNDFATIGFANGTKGSIPLANMLWARKRLPEQYVGKKVESPKDVLKVGDVILTGVHAANQSITLEQIPDANGALVAIDPKTGRVLALVGGYSFKDSKYNRVTQAMRQPGSVFKPFVYLAALEAGYPPTTIVKDQPVAISQGRGMPLWTPKNYENKFLGPITMRKALEKSKNLATVRLLVSVGVEPVAEISSRMNIYKNPPHMYSMALGAYETTLMNITAAFASFANNGAKVNPHIIDRVFDRHGKILFSTDHAQCAGCIEQADPDKVPSTNSEVTYLIDPKINYQMVSMLEGAVERGTAQRAKQIGRKVAGKTGTSNDSNDTWFIGFSPDLVCGVYIGYDAPKSLGKKEQGASLALPIFVNFMEKALADMPNKSFEIPRGISVIEIDKDSGARVEGYNPHSILEAFTWEQAAKVQDDEPTYLDEKANIVNVIEESGS